jgi:hypothetical protein
MPQHKAAMNNTSFVPLLLLGGAEARRGRCPGYDRTIGQQPPSPDRRCSGEAVPSPLGADDLGGEGLICPAISPRRPRSAPVRPAVPFSWGH